MKLGHAASVDLLSAFLNAFGFRRKAGFMPDFDWNEANEGDFRKEEEWFWRVVFGGQDETVDAIKQPGDRKRYLWTENRDVGMLLC
jgi:hypothetical protein